MNRQDILDMPWDSETCDCTVLKVRDVLVSEKGGRRCERTFPNGKTIQIPLRRVSLRQAAENGQNVLYWARELADVERQLERIGKEIETWARLTPPGASAAAAEQRQTLGALRAQEKALEALPDTPQMWVCTGNRYYPASAREVWFGMLSHACTAHAHLAQTPLRPQYLPVRVYGVLCGCQVLQMYGGDRHEYGWLFSRLVTCCGAHDLDDVRRWQAGEQ